MRRVGGESWGHSHGPAQGDSAPCHELLVGEDGGNFAGGCQVRVGRPAGQRALRQVVGGDVSFHHHLVLRPGRQHQDGEHAGVWGHTKHSN